MRATTEHGMMSIIVADPLVVADEELDAFAVREEIQKLLNSRSTLTHWEVKAVKGPLALHARREPNREKSAASTAPREVKTEGEKKEKGDDKSKKGKGKGKKGKRTG